MRKRTLGEGRVLGSGRSLNPAAPTSSLQKDSRIHSPSPSSVSLNSQGAVSHMSVDTQDIVSRISLENGDSSISRVAAAAGSSRLACPICNEEMVSLHPVSFHAGKQFIVPFYFVLFSYVFWFFCFLSFFLSSFGKTHYDAD